MKPHQLAPKTKPYHKGLAIGVSVAFFGGLVVFGGLWALVIAVICLLVGIMLGLVCGIAISDSENTHRITTLEGQYMAAGELAYKLNEELQGVTQRAESAERDLLASAAEKTALRAQLEAHQVNGTA